LPIANLAVVILAIPTSEEPPPGGITLSLSR
jgi:hypothetical protein